MKTIILSLLIFCSGITNAQVITSCQNPKGTGFYHHHGQISSPESGWKEEKITGGITTLNKMADGKYDILIVDARKSVLSFRQDGGEIILLRKGANDATFLHMYPGMVIELYTFWKDAKGKFRFDMLQSKGGDGLQIHKSTVMIGECSAIDFSLIK